MDKRVSWSKEDIDFLKKNIGKISYLEMSKCLNKSIPSIATKINKLNIGIRNSKRWKNQELEFLINNYSQYGTKYCAEKLKKTSHSVWQMAKRLKLSYISNINKLETRKNNLITDYLNGETPTDLAKKYNSDVQTINDFLLKYKIRGKNKHLRKTKLNNKSPAWKGYKEISRTYFGSIIKSAKERNIPFEITIEYIWDLFLSQNRKCALSNVDIAFNTVGQKYKRFQTASLDRINSKMGYIKGNVQWVHKTLNHMKMALDEDEFVKWCNLVTSHKGKQQ